ncbi:MAG: PilZ domain-containing protein [Spirochaetes bacterium]|nr:PilZ domain-containing protein [Spirochaetota bacterium]
MKDDIKYEKLSQSIKSEINKYYNKEKKKNSGLTIEDAMFRWFDNVFDKWIAKTYLKGRLKDKRKYFRLDIEIPVRITKTLIESSKEEAAALDLVGTIQNISRGGLYFKSKNHIEISSIIMIKIDLSSADRKLNDVEALAMVIRSDKLHKNEFGIGLMFSSIYDKNKENLDLFIFRNVAHHMPLYQK